MRLEVLGQLKNPMTSSGIEPATYRLVEWCLSQNHEYHEKVQSQSPASGKRLEREIS
jgi:hypothetical protein